MRILHIHPSMQGGGIESMICGLANKMAESNSVTVCSIFKPNKTDIFWNKLSGSVKRETLGKETPGFSPSYLFKILKYIQKGKYDIVNIHGAFYYYFLSVLILHKSVQFVYTFHSDAYMENSSRDKQILPLKKYALRKSWIHPVTISEASQSSFRALYKVESSLIENGIPKPIVSDRSSFINDLKTSPDTKVFFHPGRITQAKNQVVLCRVFKRLIEEKEDVLLLIAGSVQDQCIFSQINEFFSDRIIYLGERNDVPDLFASVDGFCLPSIWEGLPVTLLEALSVGCIPVCSPVGGIVNVIEDGYNGFLSKSSKEDDYYVAMRRLLALNSDQLKQLKSNAKKSFEKYDISLTVEEYLMLYNKLISS